MSGIVRGISDHPAKDEIQIMWEGGIPNDDIIAWLNKKKLPSVKLKTLSSYAWRHWTRTSDTHHYGVTHLVIPDTQVKPGVPTDNLRWIGEYILDRRPDVVVHLGDHWDLPSLSSYDKGKKSMEGRRYEEDVIAGNEAFQLLDEPTNKHNRVAEKPYKPRKVLLRGNHEYRISRAIEDNAQLDGTIGYHHLESPGWEVHDFLEVVKIDGVSYSHFFANPMTGRPYGGVTSTRLKTIGASFTMGHQQTLDYSLRYVLGKSHHGLIAGAAYLHEEDYLGPQGNSHWRGVIVKHQVEDGSYDPMFVSLDYLCRKYEGVPLEEFKKG